MNSSYLNMAAGAFLGTVFVVMSVSLVSEALYHSEAPEQEGFAIEVVEAEAGGGAAEEEATPIAVLLQNADPAAGEASFRKCASCHDATEGGPNKVGPNLWDVVNRPIASHEGFSYSAAMTEFSQGGEVVWDYEHLAGFLHDPRGYIEGTAMSFAGLSREDELANVIAYLRTLSNDPAPLPEPEAAAAEGGEGEAAAGGDAAAEGEAAEGDAAAGAADEQAAPAEGGDAAAQDGTATAEEAAPEGSAAGAEAAGEGNAVPADGGTQAPTEEAAPAEGDDGAAGEKAAPAEETAPAEQEQPAGETQPAEEGAATGEQGAPEEAAAPTGQEAVPAQEQAVAPADEAAAEDQAASADDAAAAEAGPAVALLAEADAANGEALFRRCQACHTVDEGGQNRIGPNLWGVVNRPVASHEGFSYSDAMVEYAQGGEVVWDYNHLDAFLLAPRDEVDGTKMAFPGIKDDADRADVIAYLRTLAAEPAPLPGE